MKRLLSALSADLLIENAGYRCTLSGGNMSFVARFPSLSSLIHFAPLFWSLRKYIPPGLTLRIQWGRLTWVVLAGHLAASGDPAPAI